MSGCYDDNYENCYAYGRLYQPGTSRCPSGYSVPTKDDWSRTMQYISKYSEIDSVFGFSRGGYCYEGLNGVACIDLGKVGYYLAGDSTVAVVKGRSVSFQNSDEESFYQLRCIKYSYIVPKVEDLPECDSASRYSLGQFYVMDKKSNYRCIGTRWVDDFTNSCGHAEEGMSGVYNDSMYICKYREWQLADISDSKDKCTDINDRTTYLFNGVYYACEEGSWRTLKNLELQLGYCKPSMVGTIDSLYTTVTKSSYLRYEVQPYYSYAYYTCDSTGWRTSYLKDFMGVCDSTMLYDEDSLHDVRYVCRNNEWDTFSTLEKEIGVCSPRKQGLIDTTSGGRDYICDSTEWHYPTKQDYLGDCVPKNEGKIRPYDGGKYICRDSLWEKLSATEAELGICTEKIYGKVDSVKSGYTYICDSTGWRSVKPADIGGVCNASKQYKVIEFNSEKYYCDEDGAWVKMSALELRAGICMPKNEGKRDSSSYSSYYYCDGSDWVSISRIEYKLGLCTEAIDSVVKTFEDLSYRCRNGSWISMSVSEALGKCDSTSWGKTKSYKGSEYACKFDSWVNYSSFDQENGICSGKTLGKVIDVNGKYYICSSSDWTTLADEAGSLGDCDQGDSAIYKKAASGIYYRCRNYKWSKVDTLTAVFGNCNYNTKTSPVVFNNKEYVCDPQSFGNRWYLMQSIDSVSGYCGSRRLNDTLTYKGKYYLCKNLSSDEANYKWTVATYRGYMRECTIAREGHKMFNGLNYSVCTGEEWVGYITDTLTDSRDGQKYRVQKINGVTWMIDNLNYATTDSSNCVNGTTSCDKSGRLYALSVAKTVCPAGWTLPDTATWGAMVRYMNALDTTNRRMNDGDIFWQE